MAQDRGRSHSGVDLVRNQAECQNLFDDRSNSSLAFFTVYQSMESLSRCIAVRNRKEDVKWSQKASSKDFESLRRRRTETQAPKGETAAIV